MRRRHRHFNARDLGAGLVFDARYINQSDNTAVSTWSDRSGNGYDATQAAGANQPTFQAAEFGGNGVVRFDGSNDFLQSNGAVGLIKNVNGGTLFGVAKFAAASSPTAMSVLAFATPVAGPHRAIMGVEVASGYYAGGRRLDADSFASALTASYTQNRTLLQTAVFDWANSDLFVFLDGTQSASNTSFQTDGSTSNTDSANVRVGGGSQAGQRMNGDIGQALAFNTALTASQRKRVEHAAAYSFKISCN